jgi:hypothetical protein
MPGKELKLASFFENHFDFVCENLTALTTKLCEGSARAT